MGRHARINVLDRTVGAIITLLAFLLAGVLFLVCVLVLAVAMVVTGG